MMKLSALIALTGLFLVPAGPVPGRGPGSAPRIPADVYLAQAGSRARNAPAPGYLGDVYRDPGNGFSIRPPAQWWMDKNHPRFAVKFSSRSYEAFIIVDTVKTEARVSLNDEFTRFVLDKNREVKDSIPSFQVLSSRRVKLRSLYAFRTEAVFQAGPNRALMSIYYLPAANRIFMITTICPEAAAQVWDPVFEASLSTFTPSE